MDSHTLRLEDHDLLTGEARFTADVEIPDALYVTFVGSPVAHAEIRSIDTSRAMAVPGVAAVVTAADLGIAPLPPWLPGAEQRMTRALLADRVTRFVGESIVAVVAESEASAADAAELVDIDFEPLPAVVDPRLAAEDATLLFPDVGTNTCVAMPVEAAEDLFEGCETVVEFELYHQRMAPCPIEPRAGAARWGSDGRLTYWASTAEPHGLRQRLAQVLEVDEHDVRVIAGEVGGAFGSKGGDYPEEILVAVLARGLDRPIRWSETRSQSMVGLYHGRALVQRIKLGGRRDGTLLAYRIDVIQDAGAYPTWAPMLVRRARVLASGVYAIPRIEASGRAVVTSTTPVSTLRGAGRPEANIAIERAIDVFAAEIGLDPAEVRRRNLIGADAFPYTTATGSEYDSGDYGALLDVVLREGAYASLRDEQARRRAVGDPMLLGVGLGLFVEISDTDASGEYASVEVTPDGEVIARVGAAPHGQGHRTTLAQILASRLALPLDRIDVRLGDTDEVPIGVGSFGSRTAQAAGNAVQRAALQVLHQAKQLAGDLLEATPDDLVVLPSRDGLGVAGTPSAAVSWAELARTARASGTPLSAVVRPSGDQTPAWPSGAALACVEVDSETGVVEIRSLVACDDVGRVLNPVIVEGQIHGGLALGVAHALLEEFLYDEWGNPLTSNFGDYPVITADQVPRFRLEKLESPAPGNELGVKGVGEAGTVGAPAAILNAVVDALSHLGVRHLELPATPERVLRAIDEARGAGQPSGEAMGVIR